MKEKLKTILKWTPLTPLILLSAAVILIQLQFLQYEEDQYIIAMNQLELVDLLIQDSQEADIETWKQLVILDSENVELRHEIDVLQGKVEVLDASINGDKKRRARRHKAIEVIKATLPTRGNPIPGCPKNPSPGEIWSIAGAIIDNSDEYAVPASLIAAVIRQESAFCNKAESHAGAKGYMQLMKETAAEVAADVAGKNRRTLRTWRGRDNIQMGTAYLSQMILEFDGNIELAVKAYNAGPIAVRRFMSGEWKIYEETRKYAKKVLEYKEEYERLGLQ